MNEQKIITDTSIEIKPAYCECSTAEEGNACYRDFLSRGVKDLGVILDLPTQSGYDSDHPNAAGDVGKTGVVIDSIADMQALFNDIKLEDISICMTINATGFILLGLYVALAKQQDASLDKITGSIQNDISNEFPAHGKFIYPPGPSMDIISNMFEWCTDELPKWNSISMAGYEACNTSSAVEQEVAFTLANGKAYMRILPGTGFNEIRNREQATVPGFKTDEVIRRAQTEKLVALRNNRNRAKCDQVLQILNDKAASGENIMPAVIEAVENFCTLGEVADTLREVFGEHR